MTRRHTDCLWGVRKPVRGGRRDRGGRGYSEYDLSTTISMYENAIM